MSVLIRTVMKVLMVASGGGGGGRVVLVDSDGGLAGGQWWRGGGSWLRQWWWSCPWPVGGRLACGLVGGWWRFCWWAVMGHILWGIEWAGGGGEVCWLTELVDRVPPPLTHPHPSSRWFNRCYREIGRRPGLIMAIDAHGRPAAGK